MVVKAKSGEALKYSGRIFAMSVEDEFKARFKCPKSGNSHAETRKVAMTGTGLTKISDMQMNRFFAISCLYCGYSEFYNLGVLEKNRWRVSDILDVLFG